MIFEMFQPRKMELNSEIKWQTILLSTPIGLSNILDFRNANDSAEKDITARQIPHCNWYRYSWKNDDKICNWLEKDPFLNKLF
jgi:hypothetical protein